MKGGLILEEEGPYDVLFSVVKDIVNEGFNLLIRRTCSWIIYVTSWYTIIMLKLSKYHIACCFIESLIYM